MNDGLFWMPAMELARSIRSREVSAEEVIRAHLGRLTDLNPALNSVLQVAPESAMEQARAADRALACGDDVGPLHGVPFAVKDVFDV